jgi:hypothetical protein
MAMRPNGPWSRRYSWTFLSSDIETNSLQQEEKHLHIYTREGEQSKTKDSRRKGPGFPNLTVLGVRFQCSNVSVQVSAFVFLLLTPETRNLSGGPYFLDLNERPIGDRS